jgi:hypothetical protein
VLLFDGFQAWSLAMHEMQGRGHAALCSAINIGSELERSLLVASFVTRATTAPAGSRGELGAWPTVQNLCMLSATTSSDGDVR